MDPSKNPFYKWLGLDPKSNNPHHFKLLGVSPKLIQQSEIEVAVRAGVKRNLDLLAKVPTGQKNDAVLAKLRSRIATAEQILLDPKLRGAYKLKLKAQIQASRSSKIISGQVQHPDSASDPSHSVAQPSDLVPPTKQQTGLPAASVPHSPPAPPAVPPVPNTPAVGGATPPNAPTATPIPGQPVQIPAAVPMAVPLNAQPPVAIPVSAQPINAQVSEPDFEETDIGPVRIKTTYRRKKSKLAGPIFAFIMLAAAGCGSYLIYQNFDELVRLGRGEVNEKEVIAETTPTDKNAGSSTVESLEDDGKDKKPVAGTPVISEKPSEKASDSSDQFTEVNDPKEKETPTKPLKPESRVVSLDQSQLFVIRRDIERGYRSLFRREFGAAEECFGSASDVLDSVVQTETDQLVPDQQSLADRIRDFGKLKQHIDGFWNQVKLSAASLSGGAEIKVGDQRTGFVESKPESVILRRTGGNIEYDYSFCPPGLAMAIAELGAIEDIPTWNLQKAAFATIDQIGGADHTSMIDNFIGIAQDAGLDCSFLLRLTPLDLDGVGRPESKLEPASIGDIHPALEQFREQEDYSAVEKLDSKTALQLGKILFNRKDNDPNQRLAVLEEARLLAIQAGSASLAEDAIYELDVFGKIDRTKVTFDTFGNISKQKLESSQARQLVERAIVFLKSGAGESVKEKLRNRLRERLLKHAQRYEMQDALRRLKQMEN